MKIRPTRSLFLSVFALSLAVSLSSGVSHADPSEIAAVSFTGEVERPIMDGQGKVAGWVLKDHSVIKIHPEALENSSGGTESVKVGQTIQGTGQLVLTSPNKSYHRIELHQTDDRSILDDRGTTSTPAEPPRVSHFKPVKEEAALYAVEARLDGQIDHLILADGVVVEIPQGSMIDASHLKLGQKLTIQGVGGGGKHRDGGSGPSKDTQEAKANEGGKGDHKEGHEQHGPKYIVPMTILAGQTPLLEVPGEGHGKWTVKEGTIKHPILSVHGDVDGLLMTDGSVMRFEPVAFAVGSQMTEGVHIRAAGSAFGKDLHTQLLLVTDTNTVVNVGPRNQLDAPEPKKEPVAKAEEDDKKPGRGGRGDGLASPMDPNGAMLDPYGTLALIRMKDIDRVAVVLKNPSGKIDGFTLADGATILIPPYAHGRVPQNLKTGDPVTVFGVGGRYALGVSIEATDVKITPNAIHEDTDAVKL
jgi:hypothetical protein